MEGSKSRQMISVVVPVFNESLNIERLYTELSAELTNLSNYRYELIWINDGSNDDSLARINQIAASDSHATVIDLARNFGKEIALTAGLNMASGAAAIMIDADLQHPVKLIPEFVRAWEQGNEVVIGVRRRNIGSSLVARFRSWVFYKILNSIAETKVTPRATDFRLIDRNVIDEYNRFTERHRITRGLIDWLGFKRTYIEFDASERANGKASYSLVKLLNLAVDSFVSLSLLPLKLAGYLGIVITGMSGLLGLYIFIEKYLLKDPHNYNFSGPAILAVITLFLVGIMLSCLGLIALYIANIHGEVVNRPLYVVRRTKSK